MKILCSSHSKTSDTTHLFTESKHSINDPTFSSLAKVDIGGSDEEEEEAEAEEEEAEEEEAEEETEEGADEEEGTEEEAGTDEEEDEGAAAVGDSMP